MIRQGELERGIALDAARADIASRIQRVCDNLDQDDFTRLVERMASIEVKYRLRDEVALFLDRGRLRTSH